MKLYIDCTNGISSDMVLSALLDLGADEEICDKGVKSLGLHQRQDHGHQGEGTHHHSRSYEEVKSIIGAGELSDRAKAIALRTYQVIAAAEAEVHGETLETVHFHEVGRDRAIENIVGAAIAVDQLDPLEIYCSPIHDGHGTIRCSHGVIPVPVPAVAAMMEGREYDFVTDDVETEMVTPTGLGLLIGMGAKRGEVSVIKKTGVGLGTRDIGRGGLKIHAME
jgi:uncharacterized protein (DUF111 family)